jgi:hypothetical protein
MDGFIQDLIIQLNQRNEPTIVVFYGDHLPGFEWTEEEMKNKSLFQTEYVIWNNLNLPKEKKDVEAYQLAAYLLDLLDIHEGTMMRYHQKYFETEASKDGYITDTEVLEEGDITDTDASKEGDITDTETSKEGDITDMEAPEEGYLKDMEVLEYDILYGEHEVYNGETPFLPTDLQIGIDQIQLDFVVYQDSNLLVFGENFNQYSTVCMDDKPLETMYAGKQLLIVKGIEKTEKENRKTEKKVTVQQIGRDKVSLSTAIEPNNVDLSSGVVVE